MPDVRDAICLRPQIQRAAFHIEYGVLPMPEQHQGEQMRLRCRDCGRLYFTDPQEDRFHSLVKGGHCKYMRLVLINPFKVEL